jgi:hypothetical protein
MEAAAPRVRPSNQFKRNLQAEDLVDYCSRPNCRKEFRWSAGPGRRQAYCSEICRRAAEKELRQARARLARFEAIVHKLRVDVVAYGRSDDEEVGDEELPMSLEARQTAESAVLRADGVLQFANPDDPAVRELRMLYEAVAPVVRADRVASCQAT